MGTERRRGPPSCDGEDPRKSETSGGRAGYLEHRPKSRTVAGSGGAARCRRRRLTRTLHSGLASRNLRTQILTTTEEE